jgi:hypothetical protein
MLLRLLVAFAPVAALGGCFDDTGLKGDDLVYARELLWKALDREALFTFAGGLKPLSISFEMLRVNAEETSAVDLEKAARVRRVLPAFGCEAVDIQSELLHSDFIMDGRRYLHAVVFRRQHLSAVVSRHPDLFGLYGLTPAAHPLEILMATEYARNDEGALLLGHLLGYPASAVDFFFAAAREQRRTGLFVRRGFRRVDSFTKSNHFVWALPLNETPDANPETKLVAACAAQVLEAYKQRRQRYESTGPFALLRDWSKEGFPSCGRERWIAR